MIVRGKSSLSSEADGAAAVETQSPLYAALSHIKPVSDLPPLDNISSDCGLQFSEKNKGIHHRRGPFPAGRWFREPIPPGRPVFRFGKWFSRHGVMFTHQQCQGLDVPDQKLHHCPDRPAMVSSAG